MYLIVEGTNEKVEKMGGIEAFFDGAPYLIPTDKAIEVDERPGIHILNHYSPKEIDDEEGNEGEISLIGAPKGAPFVREATPDEAKATMEVAPVRPRRRRRSEITM